MEQYRRKLIAQKKNDDQNRKKGDIKKANLEGLLEEDIKSGKEMEASWRAAEAYHFFMLAQKQLYEGYIDASMKTVLFSPSFH